jgi:radical SAM superfamily enzyme YgiQ (UPF0313 family)
LRIALINPISRRTQGYHTVGSYIPQLGLQVLAHLVPSEHEVDIIDEVFGTQATDRLISAGKYDLVGVTSYTSGATRAYEIAKMCRAHGVRSIMGGPHASACPEEAEQHFDAVAIGECDEVWPEILRDATGGGMQRRYTGTLSDLETPGRGRGRQNIAPINGQYSVSAIQTSRGCPVGCEYCSVTKFNGAPIRRRNIADIIEEWNQTPKPFCFVVDDNFFGVGPKHAEWAKELLRAIIKHGKKRLWFSQTTINMGDDREGLDLAYRAGCRGMLIGFETFNAANLKEYHKGVNRNNLARYQTLVNSFHKSKIAIFGGFIVGADQDTPETVADTAVAAVQLGVDIIQVTNLTPLPGTKMFDRYHAEGRLFATEYPADWERHTFTETVYNPRLMTPRELDEAIYELRYAAAKEPWVIKRALRTLYRTRSFTTAMFVYGMNKGWKSMAKIQAPHHAARFGFAPRETPRMHKVRDAFRMHLRSRFEPLPESPRAAVPAPKPPAGAPVVEAAAALGVVPLAQAAATSARS